MDFGLGRLGAGFGGLGSPRSHAPAADPRIDLVGASVDEDAGVDTVVGTFFIANASGNWEDPITYTLTDDANGAFKIVDDELQVASEAEINFELGATRNITVEADNGTDDPISRSFSITINNVLEVTLAGLSLDDDMIAADAIVGDLVGSLQDVTSGSTLSLIDSAGGKYALDGTGIEVAAALTEGTDNITIRETHPDATNTPNDTVIPITVNAASAGTAGEPIGLLLLLTKAA